MQETIMEFFEILGISPEVPQTFPELLTWFVYIFVGIILVLGVFHVVGSILTCFFSFKK